MGIDSGEDSGNLEDKKPIDNSDIQEIEDYDEF